MSQDIRRNVQQRAQSAHHWKRQRPLPAQHLRHSAAASDRWLQIATREALLFHHEQDGRNGIGRIDREVLRFIHLDQRCQDIDDIALSVGAVAIPVLATFLVEDEPLGALDEIDELERMVAE